MKLHLFTLLIMLSIATLAQEYKGATAHWERNTATKEGTTAHYLKSGGGLLVAGDLFMLGSAAIAVLGTVNY